MNISTNEIYHALTVMNNTNINIMAQEFIEGLRNGKLDNYTNFRLFLNYLNISENKISTESITLALQYMGWINISKMRQQIFDFIDGKNYNDFITFKKFLTRLITEV